MFSLNVNGQSVDSENEIDLGAWLVDKDLDSQGSESEANEEDVWSDKAETCAGEIRAQGDRVVAIYNEEDFRAIYYLRKSISFENLYEALVKYDIEESTISEVSYDPLMIRDIERIGDGLIMILDPNGCGTPWFEVVKYNMRNKQANELLCAQGFVRFDSSRTNLEAVIYEEFFGDCSNVYKLYSKSREIYDFEGDKISSMVIETPQIAFKTKAVISQKDIVICMLDSKWVNDEVSGYFYYENDPKKEKYFFVVTNSDSWGWNCMRIYDSGSLDAKGEQYNIEMNIDGNDYPVYFHDKNDEIKLCNQWINVCKNE